VDNYRPDALIVDLETMQFVVGLAVCILRLPTGIRFVKAPKRYCRIACAAAI